MAVTGIDYRLLDSLHVPSTLFDPSAHRSSPILAARRLDRRILSIRRLYPLNYTPSNPPDARLAPARGISGTTDRPAIVRPRHCGPGGRPSAKTRCRRVRALIFDSAPSRGRTLTAPPSRRPRPPAAFDVPMGSAGGPVRRPYRPRTRRSSIKPPSSWGRHWGRSSDLEPR